MILKCHAVKNITRHTNSLLHYEYRMHGNTLTRKQTDQQTQRAFSDFARSSLSALRHRTKFWLRSMASAHFIGFWFRASYKWLVDVNLLVRHYLDIVYIQDFLGVGEQVHLTDEELQNTELAQLIIACDQNTFTDVIHPLQL